MLKKNKTISGFTLMEIVAVMVILGIIASFALPQFSVVMERFRAAEGSQILEALLASEKRYELYHNSYTQLPDNLDIQIPQLDSVNFTLPAALDLTTCLVAGPCVITLVRDGNLYTLDVTTVTSGVGCTDPGTGICLKMGY